MITHDDIACLAYLNWVKDGSPHGKALDYWLEAESQIIATWPLLISESKPKATRKRGSLHVRFDNLNQPSQKKSLWPVFKPHELRTTRTDELNW